MTDSLPRVFIVEDEQQIRAQLLLFLEDHDEFRLAAAESGEAALEMLEIEPADVCIVDIRLPGMDGAAFIRSATREGLCRHFLVHTGSVDLMLADALHCLGLSDEDIFLKPSNMDRILARVRKLLQKR